MSVAPGTVVPMTSPMTSPMTPEPSRNHLTFAARSPEDLLAAVPVVLGFVPEHSIVMLTFGGSQPFHARIDLPDPDGMAGCIEMLLRPAVHHGAARAVFVLYSDDADLAATLARRLAADFGAAGIEVLECLRASEGRWHLPLRPGSSAGVAYDVSDHPFRVQGILAGQVTAPSREALAARLDPDPELGAAVAKAVRWVEPPEPDEVGPLVDRMLAESPLVQDIAQLLLGVASVEGRDQAWSRMTRETSVAHVELWTVALRGAPASLSAQPAALLAFASWLQGHGALAWCAVERCLAADPDHRLGHLVAEVLNRAVAPSAWDRPRAA